MSDIITTLHPENDDSVNLYPNVKKENIPNGSIDTTKLSESVNNTLNGINERLANAIASIEQPKYYSTLPTSDVGLIVYSDGYLYSWNGTQYVTTGILYQAIANSSITSDMLEEKCINYSKLTDSLRKLYDIKDITLSLTTATYYDYILGARDTASTMSSALLDVNEGDEYLLTAVNTINNRVAGIMFFDSSNTMISYLLPNAYNVTDYYFKIPSGVSKVGLSFKTSENKGLKKITLKDSINSVDSILLDVIKNNGKIVIIGDSITAGVEGTGYELSTDVILTIGSNTYYRVKDTGYCWVNLFKKYMSVKYPNVTIINNGISGMTTSLVSTNTRLNALIPNDTDLVICALGTNDRNNTTSDIISNLSFLEDYCELHNVKCLLMDNKSCSNSNEASKSLHMEDISNIIKEVSNKYNNPVLDIYTLFNEYCDLKNITIDSLLADGLHPNDDGYKVMFILFCKLIGLSIPRLDCTWFDFDNI